MGLDIKEVMCCVPYQSVYRYCRQTYEEQAYKQQLVEHLVKPRLTFHGTRPQVIPSIV
ncbi:hypothetical protein BDV96DRAFT_588662 [Lophiotrema nucula]|uniref:Uncharacterized protein n=1 Tax=Lophiotrema nucula TaxID=690887 RepID=A0A6A5YL99_9PLEO|nr:hypothetical protein BDV96DRAFT_588662 [Lophiotrema nucula]